MRRAVRPGARWLPGSGPRRSCRRDSPPPLPPEHRDARDSLQVVSDTRDFPPGLPRRLLHLLVLPEPELDDEMSLPRKVLWRRREESANDVETVPLAPVERRRGLVDGDLGLQALRVRMRDVRWVRDDDF